MNFLHIILWMYGSAIVIQGDADRTIPCDSDEWLHIHTCDDEITCIQDKHVCDGIIDCPDGSDEKPFTNSSFADDGFQCTVKSTMRKCLLPNDYVCDQHSHCLEDECNCSNYPPFQCSPDECVELSYFCDGFLDCTNARDELIYSNKSDGFRCPSLYNETKCALPHQYVCDGTKNCVTGGDECFCGSDNGGKYDETSYFDRTCFRCLDGHGAMLNSYVCNGYIDCIDLSDECLCENPISICNQLTQEENCEFRCRTSINSTGLCITKSKVCDGSRDCPHGEDEKYCSFVESVAKNIEETYKKHMPEFACCNAGYPADCLYEHTFTNESYDGCDQFYACPKDPNYEASYLYGIKCDKVPTCIGFTDECQGCDESFPRPYCKADQMYGYRCPNQTVMVHLDPNNICDGVAACDSENPLKSADEVNCPERFYCFADIDGAEHVSIGQDSVCDCIKDCRDGSDESSCTEYSNFCCRNGEEAVQKQKTCNGIDDCSDGSDECLPECINSPFADDKHLISNKALRAFVWIIGLISSAGNLYVLFQSSLRLYNENLNKYAKITSFHVIALSAADLCVGVYLICLGIADTAYAGVYCYEEKSWRSGKFCDVMGVISMFGLQSSVFILTLMTLHRLHIVARPFKQPNSTTSLVMVLLLLLFAAILSVLPVFSFVEDYFTSHVRLQKNPFVQREVSRLELSNFASKLSSYNTFNENFRSYLGEPQTIYPWQSLFNLVRHLNESFEPQFEFGYYSSHGVCLPKMFPDREDPTWHYSMLIIVINFVSFVTIVISYASIYRQTVMTRKAAKPGNCQSGQSQRMQRKITRIIVTDFCCWMPICLIAFLKIAGVAISDEVYAVAAIVILPINSAINPFLYSNLPEVIWQRAGKAYSRIHSDAPAVKSNETDTTGIEMKIGKYSLNRSI